MDPEMLSQLLLWAFAFIFSATCHEAAHAYVAMRGGDPTAYQGGQVSLNPLPHMRREPFGMVLVPIISFALGGWMIGWASAPYDPYWAHAHPHRSARMALAGPLTNFLIAGICMLLIYAGLMAGVFFVQADAIYFGLIGNGDAPAYHAIGNLLSIMLSLNVILGVFNLLPLPPLDGHEAILLLFPEEKAPVIREKMAMVGMFGILIAWVIMNRIVGPVLFFFWSLIL